MTNGDASQIRDRTSIERSLLTRVVLVVLWLAWVSLVLAWGTYLVRKVAQGGLDAVPLGPNFVVTVVLMALARLAWRLDPRAPRSR
jgi:hypothetical protein